MNILDLAKQVEEKKKYIEDKYGEWMKKIEQYQTDINEFPIKHPKNSQQYIDNEIKKLQSKIEELKGHAEKWMKEQMDNIQKWGDKVTSNINKQKESQTKQYTDTINTFK